MGFDPQPTLEGATLRLRPLREADRDPLHTAASDPATWAGHPVKTRYERAVFDPYFDILLASSSTLVVEHKPSGEIIGCSRFYEVPSRPGAMAIGYTFLRVDHWGGAANFEMKTLMFAHVFAHYDVVWLDIGPGNIRSQKAALKLGARQVFAGRLDLGTGREDDYLSFTVSRADWAAILASR